MVVMETTNTMGQQRFVIDTRMALVLVGIIALIKHHFT